jgi:hypothetical protein
MGGRWAKQACHTSQMDRLRMCEVKSLQWKRLQGLHSGRDGVMASPPPRGGGGCWKVLELPSAFQHVLTASTVTYDQPS